MPGLKGTLIKTHLGLEPKSGLTNSAEVLIGSAKSLNIKNQWEPAIVRGSRGFGSCIGIVSIEYGLCEALCGPSIKPEVIPKDGNWFPDVSELEALLPQGIVDRSVECVYPELPQWEEEQKVSCRRLKRVIRSLADKFPKENLLLIAHVAGVAVGMRAFSKRPVIVDKVGYCSYACLQRSASSPSDLETLTKKSRGVTYCIEGERSPKSQGSLTK
ncbi:hypothetical protein AMTR_s00149p00079900 [Amborella trichopoda]|uniref:Uncharacterized protein n=1 Tax=Amborella trichopoda TaxID=13333 RepID=W1PNC3_AMBTC|nr:hypothetical protein AMTR_s00149p00079900 [Amborella trichopoda]